MNRTVITIALIIVVTAFIVGSFKGSADDREEAREDKGAQRFVEFKQYTIAQGIRSELDKITAAAKMTEQQAAVFRGKAVQQSTSSAILLNVANDIFNSRGFLLDDDENRVIGALNTLKSLIDLWRLQITFYSVSLRNPLLPADQRNVIGYLAAFLSPAEQLQCADILDELPLCIVDNKKYFLK